MAERWKEYRETIINIPPGSPHTKDTDCSANETNRSVELLKDAKNTDTRGALFNNVGRDQITYHGTTGEVETLSISLCATDVLDRGQHQFSRSWPNIVSLALHMTLRNANTLLVVYQTPAWM